MDASVGYTCPYLKRHHAEWACELLELKVDGDLLAGRLETRNRRKLLLACLLMRRPALLLMEEPAAGLINSELDELDHLVRMLAKELNVAILIIEHCIELLEAIADRVFVLDLSELIAEGSLQPILVNPCVQAAYFDSIGEAH